MVFLTDVVVKALNTNETLILDEEDEQVGSLAYIEGDLGVMTFDLPRGELFQPQLQVKVVWDKDQQKLERSVLLGDIEIVGLQQGECRILADFALQAHS